MTDFKSKDILIFLRNLLLYTAIFFGAYFLYDDNNISLKNIPHTDFSFVYAQF